MELERVLIREGRKMRGAGPWNRFFFNFFCVGKKIMWRVKAGHSVSCALEEKESKSSSKEERFKFDRKRRSRPKNCQKGLKRRKSFTKLKKG